MRRLFRPDLSPAGSVSLTMKKAAELKSELINPSDTSRETLTQFRSTFKQIYAKSFANEQTE